MKILALFLFTEALGRYVRPYGNNYHVNTNYDKINNNYQQQQYELSKYKASNTLKYNKETGQIESKLLNRTAVC